MSAFGGGGDATPSSKSSLLEAQRGVLDVQILLEHRSRSMTLMDPASSAIALRRGLAGSASVGSQLDELSVRSRIDSTASNLDSAPLQDSPRSARSSSLPSQKHPPTTAPDGFVKSFLDFESDGLSVSSTVSSFCANELHSFLLFLRVVFFYNPLDILLAWAVSAGSTCFFFYYKADSSSSEHGLVFNLNWTMLSVALIFPLSMTLTETFRRRESALGHLTNLKTNLLSLFVAHCDWDWYTIPDRRPSEPVLSGRRDAASKESGRLSPTHLGELHETLSKFIDLVYTVLAAPRVSHAAHFYTSRGRRERREVLRVRSKLEDCVISLYHEISRFGEAFKEAGLPAGEKSRLTAFENSILQAYGQLKNIKDYRTPQGLRAFARIFILVTPLVFGPYYALVAQSTSLAWAICFSCVTSMSMQGLLNLRHSLEDPFASMSDGSGSGQTGSVPSAASAFSDFMWNCGDQINLELELNKLKNDIRIIFENRATDDIHKLFYSSPAPQPPPPPP